MTVTDEHRLRDAFAGIAGATAVDPAAGRVVAASALKRRARRQVERRVAAMAIVTVVLVVATVAVIARPTGDRVRTVSSTAAPRTLPRALTVVDRLDGGWAIDPFAYDGHDVWTARKEIVNGSGGTQRLAVAVERRVASSGAVLTTVVVPQETVFSIAVGDGAVWVSGGGDGGVPDTTVSSIDLATHRVRFTRTLPARGTCSCSIAVGAGAAWIGGNGSRSVIRLDEATGAVDAVIPLGQESASLAVVGDRLQVGLAGSRVAIVDPATNRVERTVSVAAPGQPVAGTILGIDPLGTTTSRVVRSDGVAFEIAGNARVDAPPVAFLRPLGVQSSATIGSLVWATGLDQLLVSSTDGRTRGYANYDLTARTFGPVAGRYRRFVPTIGDANGLDRVLAAGRTLWIATFNGPVLVVAPS